MMPANELAAVIVKALDAKRARIFSCSKPVT